VTRNHRALVLPAEYQAWETAYAARQTTQEGTGTIEAKMISNGHSARLFGPYLYARFTDGGRYRSRYIGKATAVGSDKR
jgi:hypothetical protein